MEKQPIAENVQQLIDKLHDEGVKAAKAEALEIVEKAKSEANRIRNAAREEAEAIKSSAHQVIEEEKEAAHKAFAIASRDAVLLLKSQLFAQFEQHLKEMISREFTDEKFLYELILKISESALSEKEEDMQLLIGEIDETGQKRDDLIASLATQLAKKGIRLGKGGDRGIKILLEGENLQIDLSDKALSQLIAELIMPRYQEIFEGGML